MAEKEPKIKLCGWKDNDCNNCPYCEYDPIRCVFEEEFVPLIQWIYSCMKQNCRGNSIEWGASYRYYYGKKEVHELLINDFPDEYRNKFWELWRDGGNQAFRKLGFGVFKDKMEDWILFWEIKFKTILFETIKEKEEKHNAD